MSTHRSVSQILSSIVILTMLFSGFSLPSASAQGKDGFKRQFNSQTGKISFLGPENKQFLSASRALGTSIHPQNPAMALAKRFGSEFGLKNPEQDLKELKNSRAENGRITARYQQKYEGIPVMGGELIVNTNDNGDLYSISGEVSPDLSLSTEPTIDSEKARETALQATAKWYQKTAEDFVGSVPQLWIYDESLLQPNTRPAELVWRMEVKSKDIGLPVRELVLVNAQRGSISLHFNQIDTAWSLEGSSGIIQEPNPTATELPTETPLPTSTPEPVVTEIPTIEERTSTEEVLVPDEPRVQIASLTGATWYVASTGNDANSCLSADAPCATIQAAIDKAADDNIIMVASGTYTSTSNSVAEISRSLTLSGGWNSTFTTQNGASIIDGGGVRNGIDANSQYITVTIDHFVVQNGAKGAFIGSGIYIYGATFTLKNSSVINNTAEYGGGIFISFGTLTILNSTISGNTASLYGGAIYAGQGDIGIFNSTIAYNNTNGTGGGIYKVAATVNITNSIIAKNTDSGGSPDCFGSIGAGSHHNIIGNTAGCTVSGGMGDKFNIEPLLNPSLSGILPLHSLQVASPAIDAGDTTACQISDQRGMPRPIGSACDMGAYEYAPNGGLLALSGSGQAASLGSPFAQPFTVSVFDSSMNPAAGVTVTFTAPGSGASGVFTNSGTNTTTAITNANGNAVASTFIANNQSGNYTVNATVSSIGATANFQLTNNGSLYVDTTGSDSNSCLTALLPCATINGAIDKAVAGDTIKIVTGTYAGTGTTEVVLINKNITLSGGWNTSFTTQNGMSTIDGQGARRGVTVYTGITATIERNMIQNGNAWQSGGIYIKYGSMLTLNNSTVTGNTGPVASVRSGIFNESGSTVKLNNSTVSSNGGPGIYSSGTSITVTLNNSTISNNADVGIYNGSATLTLNNTTLSGNTGGGLSNGGGIATFNNSTISGNSAGNGGGIYNSGGTVILKNTIVAGNLSTSNGPDCSGSLLSSGYNLIGNTSGCAFTSSIGDLTNINPNLGELVGSLGYVSLRAGSPAIDAGNPAVPGSGGNACLANDERGVTRPIGARCDIGAYEYTVSGSVNSLAVMGGDGQRTGANLVFPNLLKVAALDNQGSPVPGVSVTFAAPYNGVSGIFAHTGTRITTAITNANGIAITSSFTANALTGPYTVTASTSGVGSVNFNLQNMAWYVATTGSDDNNCQTPVTPCATINGALGKAGFVAGDTVLVADGIYTGFDSQVVLVNKDVRLIGGWDVAFATQNGWSIIDGQSMRQGVVNPGVSATVERFVIRNGSAYYSGGGIYNGGTLVLNNSLVRDNTCCSNGTSGGGGGIGNFGTLTVNNSTIRDNSSYIEGGSYFSGGGIFNYSGTLTLNNSTVSGNGAGAGGGLASYSKVVLNDSTITGNRAGSGGGLYFYNGYHTGNFTFTMQNTLVASNSAWDSGSDCYGPIVSAGYNLIGNNNGCSFIATTGDLVGTNSSPIDPRLLWPPDDGQSIFTYPLISGSPAIDAGNPATPGSGGSACLGTDQRGVARPVGTKCDIGAFEYQGNGTIPAYIVAYSGTPQYLETGSPAPSVLKAVVLDEDGDTVAGATVTFTAPGGGPSGVFASTGTNISTVVTDSSGIATASAFSTNNISGSYSVKAIVAGVLDSANFQLFNGIPKVSTYSANRGSSLPGTFLCDQNDPNCFLGDDHAKAAHKYAIGTYNFYITKFNRDGLNDSGMTVVSTVHYCDPHSCPYANAFWNSEQMVFGDTYGYPLADDVVAHEFTHGVTQYESNLFYYYQSGAINESLSDLWGEYYDQSNSLGNDAAGVKWQIGEDTGDSSSIRSMSNPPAFNDPDRMSSANYYKGADDSGGVHTNSGINNKAVYLMVDGGTFNGKSVSALGWEKTSAIYYEANTNLLISGSDYSDLYYALQQACTNLIGQKGVTAGDCVEVKDAIDAVEMNAQPVANFNTDAPLCNGNTPVIAFADDLENGTSNWTFSNGSYTRWQYDSPYGSYAQSGQHFLFADDYPGKVTDASARLKSFVVPNNAYLHFSQAYDFESGYITGNPTLQNFDGGVLEYSINGGSTWTDAGSLMDFNGYKGKLFTDADNPLSGRSAFVGSSHGYVSTRLNLASLAGKTVTFRWRMGLDEAYSVWGWWVDNIKLYTCGAPIIFTDVTNTHWARNFIERLYEAGITGGCALSPLQYCPETVVTRAQMAVFLERGIHSSSYAPPAVSGSTGFWDVSTIYWAGAWVKQLAVEGITGGCGSGNYCPESPVTRAQMAIFLLRSKHGASYAPPILEGSTGFTDVDPSYWAAAWIKQLVAEGITAGCGTGTYCPESPITRAQMAVFLVRTFNLP